MITLHYHKKEYGPIAGCFNELTGKQLIKIISVIVRKEAENVARLQVLKILLKMRALPFFLIHEDIKARMLPHVEWVFDKNTLTRQLITYYKGLYGPADEFDNLTMNEWNACEIFYDRIVKAEDDAEEAFNKFLAVLYRRSKFWYNKSLDSDGDIRKPFNENEISYHEKNISNWPMEVKMSVMMWYDGCREHLKTLYQDLFSGSGNEESEPGMFEVIRGLCGEKYGSFKDVGQLNVHIVMRELEIMKKEAAEIERMNKR